MKSDVEREHFLKNEKIQVFLRIGLVSIFILSIFYSYKRDVNIGDASFFLIYILPFLVIFFNIFYYIYVLRYMPFFHQKGRIVFTMIFDVLASVIVMYQIGEFAVYYPGLLLWFIVGYGARYGVRIAYVSYITVIVSWSLLLYYSPYWQKNIDVGVGWLVAYLILPLYYFRLISELQKRIDLLYEDVDESTFKAGHDMLTQLPNRLLFEEKLRESEKLYAKEGQKYALFFIDLDGFKQVNDMYGHEVGDKVLKEAARRISEINNFTARLGGDEFVSIVNYTDEKELKERAIALMHHMGKDCKDERVKISASIGVARFPNDARSNFELKKYSDKAMYRAKQEGNNKVCFYCEL